MLHTSYANTYSKKAQTKAPPIGGAFAEDMYLLTFAVLLALAGRAKTIFLALFLAWIAA